MIPARRLDLAQTVSSGQVFRWACGADGVWLGIDGPHWFEVRLEDDHWQVETNAPESAFERLFRLDEDEGRLHAQLIARGPEMAPLLGQMEGLRLMRPSDAEETLFTFLCTPNNHIERIGGMVRHLAALGTVIGERQRKSIHRFPSSAKIVEVGEAALRTAKFGYRAKTIVEAAAHLEGRPLGWLESLRRTSYREAFGQLLEIPGVGPKLADCIALFALHHLEAVPIDTHIWQQIVRHYRPDWRGVTLTPARYREAGDLFRDRFGDLSGWAQQVMFYDNMRRWRDR